MLTPELLSQLDRVDGLISADVGHALAALAARVPAHHAIVELGTYKGRSACYLGAGSRDGYGAPVFAFDPWDSPGNAGGRFGFNQYIVREAASRNVDALGLRPYVQLTRAFSYDAATTWNRAIGLLYIDGSHTELDVERDWHCWGQFLAPGGVVVFDDYATKNNPGVAAVVHRLLVEHDMTWRFAPRPLAIGRFLT